jgi:hypothetical protein
MPIPNRERPAGQRQRFITSSTSPLSQLCGWPKALTAELRTLTGSIVVTSRHAIDTKTLGKNVDSSSPAPSTG